LLTNRQTDKLEQKHYLLGGDNKFSNYDNNLQWRIQKGRSAIYRMHFKTSNNFAQKCIIFAQNYLRRGHNSLPDPTPTLPLLFQKMYKTLVYTLVNGNI